MKLSIFFLFVLLAACSLLPSKAQFWPLSEQSQVGDQYMQIRLQGTLKLAKQKVDHLPILGLSGLAWDQDEEILYALSDRAVLYHIKISVINNRLNNAEIIHAVSLKNKKGKRLKHQYRDSEGLLVINSNNAKKGDSKLWISFEGIEPRILSYNPEGKPIERMTLASPLNDVNYHDGANKGLESLLLHPQYGFMTAPEVGLKNSKVGYHTLYTVDGKKQWYFAIPEIKNSAITALEMLPNGNILVLERALSTFFHLTISLRELDMNHCDAHSFCPVKPLAIFDNNEGWFIDNFEGLTHYRDNLYFMVSDDNNQTLLQNTLLSLFEISRN